MKTLISEQELQAGIARMAEQIQKRYAGRPLTLVGVLVGSVMLLADLIRRLDIPIRIGMIQERTGCGPQGCPLVVSPDLMSDIRGRHVLLVDDLFATGHTIDDLVPQIDDLGPATVHSAVLLRKAGRSQVAIQPTFVAFDIPDVFVVGFGLDYNGAYRNLPYIAALEPAEMKQ